MAYVAREPRIDFEGAIHHVWDRGNHKKNIFDETGKRFFLATATKLAQELDFVLYAYCMMKNHFHLLIKTGKVSVSTLMHRLLTTYSRYWNDRSGSKGHVFQGRFEARLCSGDADFLWLLRYIHRNPVKAKLVADPKDWPWSSHREYLGFRPAIVDTSLGLSLEPEYEKLMLQPDQDERPSINTLLIRTATARGHAIEELRYRLTGDVRATALEFIAKALAEGYTRVDIAAALGCNKSTVSRLTAECNFQA